MNCNSKNTENNRQREASGLDLILAFIFRTVFPVWERNNGAVSPEMLAQLDERYDWPCGIAAAAVQRLNRDKAFRSQLRNYIDNNWKRSEVCDERTA